MQVRWNKTRLSVPTAVVIALALSSAVRAQAPDAQQKAQEAIQQAQQKAQRAADQARQTAEDRAAKAQEKAGENVQNAQQQAKQQQNAQPGQQATQPNPTTRQKGRETARDLRQEGRQEGRDARQTGRDYSFDSRRHESNYRGRLLSHRDFGAKFDENNREKLTVSDVQPDSQAARAGFRQGDIVVSVNGRTIRDRNDFNRWWWANVGQAAIAVMRGQQQLVINTQPQGQESDMAYDSGENARGRLGVTFDPDYREMALVREVQSGSPAEKAGLQAGDTVTSINGQDVGSLHHAVMMIRSMQPGQEFDMKFDRPQHQTARVALAENPNRDQANDSKTNANQRDENRSNENDKSNSQPSNQPQPSASSTR